MWSWDVRKRKDLSAESSKSYFEDPRVAGPASGPPQQSEERSRRRYGFQDTKGCTVSLLSTIWHMENVKPPERRMKLIYHHTLAGGEAATELRSSGGRFDVFATALVCLSYCRCFLLTETKTASLSRELWRCCCSIFPKERSLINYLNIHFSLLERTLCFSLKCENTYFTESFICIIFFLKASLLLYPLETSGDIMMKYWLPSLSSPPCSCSNDPASPE